MKKKNQILKNNKRIHKQLKSKNLRSLDINVNQIKINKQQKTKITSKKKNLIKRINNIRIKLLLNFFKRNVIGTPVKLTNIVTQKTRPRVISKNEIGIKENPLSVNQIKVFNNEAEALNHKLNFKINKKNLLKNLIIPHISINNEVLISDSHINTDKMEQGFKNLKKVSTILQYQILYDAYELIRKSIKKTKKYNIFKYKNYNTQNLKKCIKVASKLKKLRIFSGKSLKRHVIFLQEKKAIKKLKKKMSTAFWKLRTGKSKNKVTKAYIKNQKKHRNEEKRIRNYLINEKKNLLLLKTNIINNNKSDIDFDILNDIFKVTDDYSKKDEEYLKITYNTALMYLTKIQRRNKKGISKKKSEIKIKNQIYQEGKKKIVRINGKIKKNIITLVVKEQAKKKEISKDIIIKVLLNIIRGIGKQTINREVFKMYNYLEGLQKELDNSLPKIEVIEEQIKSRLINELMTKKNLNLVLEYQKELIQKYVEYNQVAKAFPKKWVRPEVFNPFIKEYYKKKNEFDKSKRKNYQFMGTGLNNIYNIISNVIAEDNKVYTLKLPKKRLIVPSLKQIYKGIKNNSIPRYKKTKKYKRQQRKLFIKQRKKERRLRIKGIKKQRNIKKKKTTKLKVGVLRIKLKRRNMFLIFRDRKTNKVEASTTARKEYYKIYRPKETESGKLKKRDVKEPVIKAKGPIGKYISTDQFRVRVLTQAFLDLRHKLKYNVLDIEIEKKYKKKFIRTIYKKYWYVFKPQGLFRICRFVKNKAHGQMRQKKARRR